MSDVRIDWNGTDEEMIRELEQYAEAILLAVRRVADYFAPILETYAKEERPWTDRTSNARQGLHAYTEELANDVVALYLSHGVEYGKQLETRTPTQEVDIVGLELSFAGKYAIILPTIEVHFPQVMQMVQEVLR